MKAQIAFISVLLALVTVLPLNAGGKNELQKYFSDTSKKVKETNSPAEKRKILDESFKSMFDALNKVQGFIFVSKNDRLGIDKYKASLQEKQDELTGSNGFTRVSDDHLNSFSDYVVQDNEQAAEMITISVVTLLLIIILAVLIL
jgi:hypothetical protein